jgi:hypothetical protein
VLKGKKKNDVDNDDINEKDDNKVNNNDSDNMYVYNFLIEWDHIHQLKIVSRLNLVFDEDDQDFFNIRVSRSLLYRADTEYKIRHALYVGLQTYQDAENLFHIPDKFIFLAYLKSGIPVPQRFLQCIGLEILGGEAIAKGAIDATTIPFLTSSKKEIVDSESDPIELLKNLPAYCLPDYSPEAASLPSEVINLLVGRLFSVIFLFLIYIKCFYFYM